MIRVFYIIGFALLGVTQVGVGSFLNETFNTYKSTVVQETIPKYRFYDILPMTHVYDMYIPSKMATDFNQQVFVCLLCVCSRHY